MNYDANAREWKRRTAGAKRNGAPWTEKDVEFVKANYRKMPVVEIATALERGFTAVVAKITKLGLYRALKWTPEQDAFLRANRGEGWVWCAKKLGKTTVAIRSRAARLGIENKMLSHEELGKLKELHAAGMVTTEIAPLLGVSDECVRVNLHKFGMDLNKRDESKRMATLKKNLMASYGVDSIARARKVRRRRLGAAALVVSAQKLATELDKEALCTL